MCSICAAHEQEKNDLNLLVDQPKPETLSSTQDSDLPQVQESVLSFQSLQEDKFSTLQNEAKEVDDPESYNTGNVGKPILMSSTVVKHLIL